jgi:hypothetical protein
MRTVIPISWIWAFCGAFVFEKWLLNESVQKSHTHRFGVPCVILEGVALFLSFICMALFLRIRLRRTISSSPLESVEVMLHNQSRRSSSSFYQASESRRNRSASYGAVEVF